jgi:hypothetical protein
MTSSGLEMPPDQPFDSAHGKKAPQMRSIWFLISPVSMGLNTS